MAVVVVKSKGKILKKTPLNQLLLLKGRIQIAWCLFLKMVANELRAYVPHNSKVVCIKYIST